MPYLPTAQSYLDQSILLISARPTTTRITTKYTLPRKSRSRKHQPSSSSPPPQPPPSTTSPSPPQKFHPANATLILKTYDPASGTCLKYSTDKAAEVGRLIAAMGSCGRVMAALPEVKKEEGGGDEGGSRVKVETEVRVKKEEEEEEEGKVVVKKEEEGGKVGVLKEGKGGKGGDKGGGGGGAVGGKKKKGKR